MAKFTPMPKELIKPKLDRMIWSFSSVKNYYGCPRCFYYTYVDKKPRIDNAFAKFGSFVHELLEGYYTGRFEFFELSGLYEELYSSRVDLRFPANAYTDLAESYYSSGLDYLNSFEGLPDHYSVLGVEEKVQTTINGYPFVGYIDLVLKDKRDGGIIVWDHKSHKKFASKKEAKEYTRQLYLYSYHIVEKYGVYPKELCFNRFRAGEEDHIVFSQDDYQEALQWFSDTISSVYADEEFFDKITLQYRQKGKKLSEYSKGSDFFCENLCSVRAFCNRSTASKG